MKNEVMGLIEAKDMFSGEIYHYSIIDCKLVGVDGIIWAGMSLDWYLHFLETRCNKKIIYVLWDNRDEGIEVVELEKFMENTNYLRDEIEEEFEG